MRNRLRHVVVVLAMLAAPLTLVVASVGPAGSLTFNVTSTADSGPGTLRQALLDAQNNGGADDVVVQFGLGTITINSPLSWNGGGSVTITGAGVTINANGQPLVFFDDAGNGLSISGVTITGMGGSTSEAAGAIVSDGGGMSVGDCTISGNTIASTNSITGAIVSDGGGLLVNNCTITGNTITGPDEDTAAILTEGGGITVVDTTITGNTITTGEGSAGGITSEGGGIAVDGATITGNTISTQDGEAASIVSDGGGLLVEDSGISGNDVSGTEIAAGGVLSDGGDTQISGTTITCNSATSSEEDAGGGVLVLAENLALIDSLVQGNQASAPNGTAEDQVFFEGTIDNDGSTISDDAGICAAPPPPPTAPAPPVGLQPNFTG